MSETLWFTRRPGDSVSIGSETDGDPSTVLLTESNALPDWVRTPPELGNQQLKVIRGFTAACPMCSDNENLVRHIECSGGLFVAECKSHGFAWYKKK